MLLDVDNVVSTVAALFDDPSQSQIDIDYVLPFINLRWSNLVVNLAMLGLQYTEDVQVFNVPAGIATFRAYMASGQPLAALMSPKSVEWKLVGEDDTTYDQAELVDEVDDYPAGITGIQEYAWQGGTLLVNPSSVPITVRVRYLAMSTQLVDPTDMMIRGVADIIAYRAAELIAIVRGGPGAAIARNFRDFGDTALDDFAALSTLQSQGKLIQIPPTHRRPLRGGVRFTMPAGSDF